MRARTGASPGSTTSLTTSTLALLMSLCRQDRPGWCSVCGLGITTGSATRTGRKLTDTSQRCTSVLSMRETTQAIPRSSISPSTTRLFGKNWSPLQHAQAWRHRTRHALVWPLRTPAQTQQTGRMDAVVESIGMPAPVAAVTTRLFLGSSTAHALPGASVRRNAKKTSTGHSDVPAPRTPSAAPGGPEKVSAVSTVYVRRLTPAKTPAQARPVVRTSVPATWLRRVHLAAVITMQYLA